MDEQEVIDIIKSENEKAQYNTSKIPFHVHNNIDSPQLKFIGLGDTPSSFSGKAHDLVAVNSLETALEFVYGPSFLSSQFVADTAISANDPVRLESSAIIYQTTTSNQLNNDNVAGDGIGGGQPERVAVRFQVGATNIVMNRVTWQAFKKGSPTDNYNVYMCADSGGAPTDTALATSANVAASGVSTTQAPITFNFTTGVALTALGVYWAVLERTGAPSSANCLSINDGNVASALYGKRVAGTWSNSFPPMDTTIEWFDGTNPGRILLASSLNAYVDRMIGFAVDTVTVGQTTDVVLSGIMDGFSALSIGSVYYLKDNSTIGTTPGTITKAVGIAVSTTSLQIMLQAS